MKVGIVGWRGMVGSVLMQRMSAEKDFDLFDSVFFSTSNAGGDAPAVPRGDRTLKDASDLKALQHATRSLPRRAAITRTTSFPSCARQDGAGIG